MATKHQQKDDLQPWTAARCQRLLRQLQCRLATLRKFVNEAQKPAPRRLSKRSSLNDNQPAPKRTRYTYTQRRQTSSSSTSPKTALSTPPRFVRTLGAMKFGHCSPAPGRVDFPTPMLRKICDQPSTPFSSLPTFEPATTVPRALLADLQLLRPLTPDGHYRIYKAIFDWLGNLLRATETKAQAPKPKSLLGMCLRRVPATMADIEAWDREVSEKRGVTSVWEPSNASTELYEQLEGFGVAGMGWKPLKLVVRVHALSILTGAISEGLFDPAFVRLLAELCMHLKCVEEASSIVFHLEGRLAAPASSSSTLSENSKLQPLRAIVGTLHGKKSPGASFDCLSQLIRAKKLPVGWLSARGFRSAWTSGLEAMTTSKPAPSVLEFMCTALEHLALNDGNEKWSRQSSREQTLISMASVLTATAAMLGSKMDVGKNIHRVRASRRLLHALDRCISEMNLWPRAARDGGLFILALARYLAVPEGKIGDTATGRQAARDCGALLAITGGATPVQYRQALVLTCSIAQYRGRACGVPCHDVLSKICSALNRLALPDWFRAGLRTDGAFVLAQKTKDLRDLAFAERLSAAATEAARAKTIFSGWRWEEGISEWVVPSPGQKTGRGRHSTGEIEREAGDGGRSGWGGASRPDRRACDSDDEHAGDETEHDDDRDSDSFGSGDELAGKEATTTCRQTRRSSTTETNTVGRLVARRRALAVRGSNVNGSAARGSSVKGVAAPSKPSSRGSTEYSQGSQGAAARQRWNARGLSQTRHRGAALGDDDWDELV
ncbi:Fc.00g075800.m01.CDS01 [Cosmosporella sp. VM-42]